MCCLFDQPTNFTTACSQPTYHCPRPLRLPCRRCARWAAAALRQRRRPPAQDSGGGAAAPAAGQALPEKRQYWCQRSPVAGSCLLLPTLKQARAGRQLRSSLFLAVFLSRAAQAIHLLTGPRPAFRRKQHLLCCACAALFGDLWVHSGAGGAFNTGHHWASPPRLDHGTLLFRCVRRLSSCATVRPGITKQIAPWGVVNKTMALEATIGKQSRRKWAVRAAPPPAPATQLRCRPVLTFSEGSLPDPGGPWELQAVRRQKCAAEMQLRKLALQRAPLLALLVSSITRQSDGGLG